MFERAAAALAAGRSAVLDAVFLREDERESAAALARRAGARFDGLWLELPRDLAAARIRERRSDVSDATVDVLDAQLAREAGPVAWPALDAGSGAEAVAEAARAALGRRG
jgi:predicted kinase